MCIRDSSQVVGHVGNEGGGDGGLDDRGAVDAHEPEEAHGAVDHSEADVAIGSGEQGLEHLDDTLGDVYKRQVRARAG